jgi:putative transposase
MGTGGGEGAKFWMSVLVGLKNRAVRDVFFLVCDGLKGLPPGGGERLAANYRANMHPSFDQELVPSGVAEILGCAPEGSEAHIHSTQPGRRGHRAGRTGREMGKQYGALIRLWRNAWEQFIPFLDYDVEIRKVICSTNAIESLNARYRRAIRARGHFPTEQAAMECLYLVTRRPGPHRGRQRPRTMRWKPVINAFAITFGDRWPAAETY